MDSDLVKQLEPLTSLAGVLERDNGADMAPEDDRGTEQNTFRERITFSLPIRG